MARHFVLKVGHVPSIPRIWPHMRASTRDFLIHYLTPANGWTDAQRAAAYDYLVSKFDDTWSSTPQQVHSRNENALVYDYALLWHPYLTQGNPSALEISNWLSNNSYSVEDGWLHYVGTSKTQANRVQFEVAAFPLEERNVPNFGYAGIQAFFQQDLQASIAAGYDTILYDTVNTYQIEDYVPAQTLEYNNRDDWLNDMETTLASLKAIPACGHVAINTGDTSHLSAGWRARDGSMSDAAGCTYAEWYNNPNSERGYLCWSFLDTRMAAGTKVWFVCQRKPQILPTVHGDSNLETQTMYSAVSDRSALAVRRLVAMYCNFLMLTRSDTDLDLCTFQTFGDIDGGFLTAYLTYDHEYTWLPMYERDIGLATMTRASLQSGNDNTGQPYNCFYRTFENALVLYRPRMNWAHTEYGDNTALTFTLPTGTWRQLWPDNTTTGIVSTVSLRNGEGAIFMDAS